MTPGTRLRSWASRLCSARTMERLIDPVIADMQCEHDHANRSGRPTDRWRLLFKGYLAFWKVLALHVPIAWAGRIIRVWVGRGLETPPHEHAALARALGATAVTIVVLSALFIAPPLKGLLPRHDAHWMWLAVLIVPQSLPLCLPLSLLVGVLWGFGSREELVGAGAGVLCESPALLAGVLKSSAIRARKMNF